jgi:PAS domain S-box-containing protein
VKTDLPSLEHRLILGHQSKDLLLGDYRRRLLVGELSVLSLFFNIIYLFLDLFSGGNIIIVVYIINILLLSTAFYTNRIGKFEIAKIILLYTVLISVYLFGSNNLLNTETYLLYLPLALLAFELNGYNGRYFSIAFSCLSLLLYFLDAYTNFSVFPQVNLSTDGLRLMSTINFVFSLVGIVYISYFMTKTYYLSEKNLISRQIKLNKLTKDLRTSQQRYKLAMLGTNAGLWDWNLISNKIYHGPKWKEMLGYNSSELENADIEAIYSMVHPQDLEMVKQSVEKHLKNQEPFELEYRIRKKDGKYEWFYDSGKAIFNNGGKPIRMVGSIINVSKRKTAEEKILKQKDLLEKANAELDRFVYITSHDLKAPLLSIQGLIHLAEISEDKSEVEMCLKMMMERIKGLENFIRDIIDYSRNVRVGLVKEEIDIEKMIGDIYKDLFYLENVDKIDFKIEVDKDLSFNSDEKRVNVILKNLIFNAVKYQNFNQKNPYIKVKANEDGNHLVISVKDNGEGIKPDIQDKVYDMFFRASEKSSGSGLGLYIVKEMVGKLDGTIQLKSEPDKGSEFTVRLPTMA